MARCALVEPNGRVAQLEEEAFPIAEPYKWIECGDEVDTSYRYDGEKFVTPEEVEPDAS